MKTTHRQEKEQFKRLFKQESIDNFEDRFKVLEAFLQTERHVTALNLEEMLKESGHLLTLEFIEETLELIRGFGFALGNRFDNGEVCYEHRHLGQHHDHMICTKCRRIIEFRDDALEELQLRVAEARGFHMLQHRMEIYGICSDCLKERTALMPLGAARPGERLVIKELTGGASVRMRLLSMGLRIGDEIMVITNQGRGRIAVAVDFKRYVLGRGLAEKIRVQPKEARKESDLK
ncbi:MAG: Fur family transcriptional regulator [Desulfobacterales bacterium]|nr:Fur family transcriptional regulator [Desulfobacterales bacterium]